MDSLIYPKAKKLNAMLQERGLMLAVAESCTGGGLGKAITEVSGCSANFYGGFVTYASEAKIRLLGVDVETLASFGAVSEQTAKEMAQGVLSKCPVDIALSITGVAGPASDTDKKPVGTVYFGLAKKGSECEVRKMMFPPGRSYIRERSIAFALSWLIDSISQ